MTEDERRAAWILADVATRLAGVLGREAHPDDPAEAARVGAEYLEAAVATAEREWNARKERNR